MLFVGRLIIFLVFVRFHCHTCMWCFKLLIISISCHIFSQIRVVISIIKVEKGWHTFGPSYVVYKVVVLSELLSMLKLQFASITVFFIDLVFFLSFGRYSHFVFGLCYSSIDSHYINWNMYLNIMLFDSETKSGNDRDRWSWNSLQQQEWCRARNSTR